MIIWLTAAALGLGLAALEARRPDRRHIGLRMAAILVAVASLAALLRPPMVPSLAPRTDAVLLVTPGMDAAGVQRLRDSLPDLPVFRWPDSVPDLDVLRLRLPDLRFLHVSGWGLRESLWTGHEDLHLSFHPSPSPPGFRHLAWPPVVRLGDQVTVTARLAGAEAAPVVWIERPDGVRDSAATGSLGDSVAQFHVIPRAEGATAYVIGGTDMPAETLQVMVLPPQPPAVLILEAAPSFETTFLRRWLAAQGAPVAVRTRLSRDQYRTERINLPGVPIGTVTEELLDRFDLLVVDGGTLQSLSAVERAALEGALREGGLGVLVAPDSLAQNDAQRFPFTLTPTGDLDSRMVRPRWSGQRAATTAPVPALAQEIVATSGIRPLMRDPVGRIVAATAPRGAGVVGTSMISAPSRWLLEEEPAAFAGYWQAIISAVARDRGDEWARATDGAPSVDHGLSLVLVSSDTLPHATVTRPDGAVDTLGLARDPAEPRRWWGRYWPLDAGWHRATNRDGESYPFHVSLMRETAREAAARLAATARRSTAQPAPDAPSTPRGRRPLPPLWPFLALVVATGVLWGEGRLASGPGEP